MIDGRNQIVSRVAGEDEPVAIWSRPTGVDRDSPKRLYTLTLASSLKWTPQNDGASLGSDNSDS